MNTRRRLFYGALIGASLGMTFLFVAINYLTYSFPEGNFDHTLPVRSTSPAPAGQHASDETANYYQTSKIFTDAERGFSFQYPASWSLEESNPLFFLLYKRNVSMSLTATAKICDGSTSAHHNDLIICNNFLTKEGYPANVTVGKRTDHIVKNGGHSDISYGYVNGTIYNINNDMIDEIRFMNTFDAKVLDQVANAASLPQSIREQISTMEQILTNTQTVKFLDVAQEGYREHKNDQYGFRFWYPAGWGDTRQEFTTFYFSENVKDDQLIPDYFTIILDPEAVDYCQERLPDHQQVLHCEQFSTTDSLKAYIRVSHDLIGKDIIEAEIPKIDNPAYRKVRLETILDDLSFSTDQAREVEREKRLQGMRMILESFSFQRK
jgi:hypothetical protein